MPRSPTTLTDELGIALSNLAQTATGAITPTLRLGVTGLSRAGKTIFITALVNSLIEGRALPGFTPIAEGRFLGAQLSEHPDRAVPRFAYEQHLSALTGAEPHWPESTRRISQLRLTLKYQSANWLAGMAGPSTLHLDIVDYPGEWLLDLPLLSMSYAEWSADALTRAQGTAAADDAAGFCQALAELEPNPPASEPLAELLAQSFTTYLRDAKSDKKALSTLPPGRFLLPGDLEGSPALTFAPLPAEYDTGHDGSLYALMERRYEAYKHHVIRPFFRDHFARLDRQIVLVDALRALNAGPDAVADLEEALASVLTCFRQGRNSPLNWLLARKIDKILFAATKADHLHHTSHHHLQAILERLVSRASRHARFTGADTRALAMAAVRATKEGTISEDGQDLACIIGTPLAGEKLGATSYDGRQEIALFPGDLPESPDSIFEPEFKKGQLNFLRFRPPGKPETGTPRLPHIRLDQAADILFKDWMQ